MKKALTLIAIVMLVALAATMFACNKPVQESTEITDPQLLQDKATLEEHGYTVNVNTGDLSVMENSIHAQKGTLLRYLGSSKDSVLYVYYFSSEEAAKTCYENNKSASYYKLYKNTLIFNDTEDLLGK